MLESSSWVSTLFRVVNFGFLILLATYIFRRYLKNRVEEKITQKEAVLKGLEEQGYFLEGRAYDLDEQLQKQEMKAIDLKQKIDEWNIQVLAQKNKRQEEYKINALSSAQRIIKKNEYLAQWQWRLQVLPDALKKTEAQLLEQFEDQSRNEAYVHDVVRYLEKP